MKKSIIQKKQKIAPYLMILPVFALLGLFYFYPIYIAITKSFYNWSGGFGTGINKFIGFDNYVRIFQDELFITSWLNVLFFVVGGVIINLIFPPLFAILVNSFTEKTSFVIRVINIIPIVVPSVVVFLLWKNIYNAQYGFLTQLVQIFDDSKIVDLLGQPETAKWAILLMGCPWTGGTNFLIYYAGLNNISNEAKEAAVLDGANAFQMVVYIYYPLLVPQLKLITAMVIISTTQNFVNIQTITNGGPGDSTYVPGLYVYDMAFKGIPRYGAVAAASVFMSAIICLLVFLNNKFFSRGETNE